jgi:rhamnosyl/mannosyltransferase
VARVGQQLVAGYRAAGHQVEVLERRQVGEGALGEVRLSALALAWPRVAKRLDGCDLVHVHGPAPAFADVFLLACALRRRHPPLLYSHNFEVHFPGPFVILGRLYERAVFRLAARVAQRIVVSTEQFRRRLPDPSVAVVVPWGCDHRAVAPRSANGSAATESQSDGSTPCPPELKVLFVGQMRPYKGLPVLIQALQGLHGVAAKLAGGGRRLAAYRRRLERASANTAGRVEGDGEPTIALLGPVDDARLDQLYGWADVVVLPSLSRQEAFGLVLLEGMRAGCVPVASRLPGVAEVVGDAGVLVEPGDVAALRAALVELRDDRRRLAELAELSRGRAAERTWARTVDRHLELAREIVEEGGRPRGAAHSSRAAS